MPGYYRFLTAMNNPRHREHRRMTDWYGGPYDVNEIDLRALQHRLGGIAQRRHAGRTGYEKSVSKA